MATTRFLRTSRPIQLPPPPPPAPDSSFYIKCVRYQSIANLNGDHNIPSIKGERKPVIAVKATMATTDHITTSKPVVQQFFSDIASLIASIHRNAILFLLRTSVKRKPRNLQPQMLIERVIIDCRFFTLFAVAGSLLGSVLCFVEGCLLVIESYAHYFHMLSQKTLDQGHLVHLLIEAIDTFLIGTALLIFGVGMYVMFVGSSTASEETEPPLCGSNLFHLFHMKLPPRWLGTQSIGKAKSKIGHAVMMILQVGLLDKLKDIPLVTGFDLACFAAAVLTSSACIFVLSKLHQC